MIETYSGGGFDVLAPEPSDVHLQDIAGALAHTCRSGGHCRQFYSVANHSLHVSREVPDDGPRLELLGLLHDAAEAYLGDIPRPLKAEYDVFEERGREILRAVWLGLGVSLPTDEEWEQVMAADDRLLTYEADQLLADGAWAAEPPARDYDLDLESADPVRQQFLSQSESLLDRL